MIGLLKKYVNSAIGTASAKPLDTMISEIKATNLITNGSAVKSVQRGSLASKSGFATDTSFTSTVTISPVTPSKCVLILSGGIALQNGTRVREMASTGTDLNKYTELFLPQAGTIYTTSISIYQGGYDYYRGSTDGRYVAPVSWQLIEYY